MNVVQQDDCFMQDLNNDVVPVVYKGHIKIIFVGNPRNNVATDPMILLNRIFDIVGILSCVTVDDLRLQVYASSCKSHYFAIEFKTGADTQETLVSCFEQVDSPLRNTILLDPNHNTESDRYCIFDIWTQNILEPAVYGTTEPKVYQEQQGVVPPPSPPPQKRLQSEIQQVEEWEKCASRQQQQRDWLAKESERECREFHDDIFDNEKLYWTSTDKPCQPQWWEFGNAANTRNILEPTNRSDESVRKFVKQLKRKAAALQVRTAIHKRYLKNFDKGRLNYKDMKGLFMDIVQGRNLLNSFWTCAKCHQTFGGLETLPIDPIYATELNAVILCRPCYQRKNVCLSL